MNYKYRPIFFIDHALFSQLIWDKYLFSFAY